MGIANFAGNLKFAIFFLVWIFFSSSYSKVRDARDAVMDEKFQSSYFLYQTSEYQQDCYDLIDECPSSNSSGVFLIKPVGYLEPFQVFCNNEDDLGGWTVIMRRFGGSLLFNRDWEAYKNGFGFLSTEFWLGNYKISHLTNQAVYELRIDITLSNGASFFAGFDAFRISDEWSDYKLVLAGNFRGNIEFSCPSNMVFGNCTCQPTCDDPTGVNTCHDNCEGRNEFCTCSSGLLLKDGQCVVPDQCECFITEKKSILTDGGFHVNSNCTERCTCHNGILLNCDANYKCSSNATCGLKNGVRGCHCNDGFEGDGETCTVLYRDCYDVYRDGHGQNGVYTILPTGWPGSAFNVFCDMTTTVGGWTLFQRRVDGVTDFYRFMADYENGFGSVEQGNDFWLGNEQLYYLTNQGRYQLRVDIVTPDGLERYAEYTFFQIKNNSTNYRLSIGAYSGDADNGMVYTNGASFSARDKDSDGCSYHNCAESHRSAWWYAPTSIFSWCSACATSYSHCWNFETVISCTNRCSYSNLNGNYSGGNGQNIFWGYSIHYSSYCSLNFVEMKVRPSSI